MTDSFAAPIFKIPPYHPLYQSQFMEIPASRAWQAFTDDFNDYTLADWTITTTELGAGDATEVAASSVLTLTNDAADNDNDFLQLVQPVCTTLTTRKLYFEARFRISEVIQCDAIIGMGVTDTTPLATASGAWFGTDDGDALLDFHSAKASVQEDLTGVYTLVAGEFVTVAFAWNPDTALVTAYVGRNRREMVAVGTCTTAAWPNAALRVSWGIQNGEAVINTMGLDYYLVAREV